jgi:hypothetical protein
MAIVDTSINPLPTSIPWNPDPLAAPQPTSVAEQHVVQSRGISMSDALRQQTELESRKAEEDSGAMIEARTWLRSRSTQKALLDLTVLVLDISKRLGSDNEKV